MIENAETFFIVGGQRCGSTFLYNILDQHEDICMSKPVVPEPKYFLKKENLNKRDYYKNFFKNYKNEKVIGEKSTSYFEKFDVPLRLKSFFPNCKILIILRNPADRAISNYFFSVKNDLEKRTIEEVFLTDNKCNDNSFDTSVSPYDYIYRGFYTNFILNYFKIFNKYKIKVIILEKIIKNNKILEEVFDFLNVSRKNINFFNQSKVNFVEYPKNEKIKKILSNKYRDEIKNLEKIINHDLSIWQ